MGEPAFFAIVLEISNSADWDDLVSAVRSEAKKEDRSENLSQYSVQYDAAAGIYLYTALYAVFVLSLSDDVILYTSRRRIMS